MVDEVAKSQSEIWNGENVGQSYQEARERITRETFNNMAKHKGIGVNEVATEFSFYAPYKPKEGSPTWGWFKTAAEAVAGTQKYATSWDNDYVLIGHANSPFVIRGGYCDYGSAAGVLYTSIAGGHANYHNGFRPVVVL